MKSYYGLSVIGAFKLTLGLTILGFVLWLVDWGQAIEVAGHADAKWLVIAFACLLLSFIPAAMRWAGLLRALGISYLRVACYRVYLIGAFYSLAMPGVIGGDAARVFFCQRETLAPLALVAGTVLMERGLGALAMITLLSLGLYVYPEELLGIDFAWAPGFALLLLVFVASLPLVWRALPLNKLQIVALEDGKWQKRFKTFLEQLAPFTRMRALHLLGALGLSFLFQALDILATFAIAKGLGLEVSIWMLLVAMPVVFLATVLPISPAGLGVREGTLVVVLTQFGLSAPEAALLAVAVFLNKVAVGLVGAAQHFAGGKGALSESDH